MNTTLEVCVDNAAGVMSCVQAGADRIELCACLAMGGLTPSAGLMQLASEVSIPTHAMIRPRDGGFHYSEDEVTLMCCDIETAKAMKLAGVVFGASTPNATLDIGVLSRLCDAAGSLSKTLHRLIDTLRDPISAVDQAIDLGFNRILTSGGAKSVAKGIVTLEHMQKQANGRIEIMAGAGLSPELVIQIRSQTGIHSFHASCREPVSTSAQMAELGFSANTRFETSVSLISAFQRHLTDER